ncbi:hypothetical protein [Butyrivibrio sp. LB2008]|uniref:hypothetical protein n=1 Tax=Butyrivibrio sp. LB2008 TaxID=1408305 RepID=UPI00047BE402|nr:hypothetical protein [Butyrivibrio sp. LB2008]
MACEKVKEALKTLTSEDISAGVVATIPFFAQMEHDPEKQLFFVLCEDGKSVKYKIFDAIANYAAEEGVAIYEVISNLFPNDQTVVKQLKISKEEIDLCCLLKIAYGTNCKDFCWNVQRFKIMNALLHRGKIDLDAEQAVSRMMECGFSSEEDLCLFWEKMKEAVFLTFEQFDYSPSEYKSRIEQYRSVIEAIKKIVTGKDFTRTVENVIGVLKQSNNLSDESSIEELISAKNNEIIYKKMVSMAENNDKSSITMVFEALCNSRDYAEIDVRHFIDFIVDEEKDLPIFFDAILCSKRVRDTIFEKKFMYSSNRWLILHALCGQDSELKDEIQGRLDDYLVKNAGKYLCNPEGVVNQLFGMINNRIEKWNKNENVNVFNYAEDDDSEWEENVVGTYSDDFVSKRERLKKYYLAAKELADKLGVSNSRNARQLERFYK